ncbi:nuclear transport factor 2 family protein [Tenacibaculum halocynthiae]|uniref:nuclear transport factor 2 family protein n=1 Tax=Tenacibaculum halocynthiae TaxID=1254437 RepID=UPI003D646B9A
MKSVYTLLIFAFLSICSFSQNKKAIIREVNQELWKPFKKHFEAKNWKEFNKLHTDDVLRVNSYGIRMGKEYKNTVKSSYQKTSTRKRQIDFSFEQRVYKKNIGYEVGYYRIKYTEKNKEPFITYGRFHVVINKLKNKWLISQDWDTDVINGTKITAEYFNKGTLLRF